jgi:hypothetical protein
MSKKEYLCSKFKNMILMNLKFRLFFMLFLSALCVGFTACSNDDDEDYAKAIAGTYNGGLTMEGAPIASNVAIAITRDAENQITLKMNETVLFMQIDIICKSGVTYASSKYAISGTTTFNMEIAGTEISMPVPVRVNGTIDKSGTANIQINVDIPDAPVTVIFGGQK